MYDKTQAVLPVKGKDGLILNEWARLEADHIRPYYVLVAWVDHICPYYVAI